MQRREFLHCLGLGLAGCWVFQRPFGPGPAAAGAPELRLAFLADAHLPDGGEHRPEAQALARAVAELRNLTPAPQLVLFAGDLAHKGHPAALALGREILADLPAPLFMVMGEGDGAPDNAAPWRRRFGEPWFSQLLRRTANGQPQTVLQILGLHTAWCPGPGGPAFRVGDSGRRWLARELARLDPEAPLLLLSHAPLAPIFLPWQQWTVDGPEVMGLLARFRRVLCLHGHTHNAAASCQWPVASKSSDFNEVALAENQLHLALPATAWPGPQALMGTPARLRPGLGPAGCGWLLISAASSALQFQPQIWQA